MTTTRPRRDLKGYDLYKTYQKSKDSSAKLQELRRQTRVSAGKAGGAASRGSPGQGLSAAPAANQAASSGLSSAWKWFFGGLMLRAPAVFVLRSVAQLLMAGPMPVKAVGGFILFVLGLTATSEGDADDPFSPDGDPSGSSSPHTIQLPSSVDREKEREIPVPKHWKHRVVGDVVCHRVPVAATTTTSSSSSSEA